MYTWSPVKHIISIIFVIGLLIVGPASPFVPPLGIDSISFESIPTQVLGAFDEVRVAYLPNNVDTAIAVGVAEALAGALGGIASRGTAKVLGNRKKDSLQTKVQTTSAFFGTRGLLRASGRVLGLPRPLTLVAASVLGSIASEATKKFGRAVDEQKRSNSTQDSREPLNILSGSEITGDVMKWLSYDLLFQATAAKVTYPWEVPLSFVSGGTAAVIGLLVYDLLERARLRDAFARSANNKYFSQHSKLPRTAVNDIRRPAATAVPSPLLQIGRAHV